MRNEIFASTNLERLQILFSNNQLLIFLSRLDGHHVVFGKVLSGMDVVSKMENEGRQSGTPKSRVVILDSGEMPL